MPKQEVSKAQKDEREKKVSGGSYSEAVREEAEDELEQVEDPKAEGWAIYDHAARSLGHVFYEPAGAEKEDAERQFARLHRHAGDVPARLSLVKFSEVAASKDVYEKPKKWEFEDVPQVDRRT